MDFKNGVVKLLFLQLGCIICIKSLIFVTHSSYMTRLPETYTFRPGKIKYSADGKDKPLKAELERKAFQKGIKLPELMRSVLRSYLKKNPPL